MNQCNYLQENENSQIGIKSQCVVCHTEVTVPFNLISALILCRDCTLRDAPKTDVKQILISSAEQERIRQQGRDACRENTLCFATKLQMPIFNPYEPLSQEWRLWKDGYSKSLVNQEEQNDSKR
jgi:hypothetical protein